MLAFVKTLEAAPPQMFELGLESSNCDFIF
jgi:hypothetical protein